MSVKYGEIATVGKVKAEIRERVAVVTLADPPGNGVGLQVTNRILELLDEYEQNETVRCVLFTHEGDDFSKSGAGAEEFTLIDQGKSMVEVSGTFRPSGLKLVERIDTYDAPGKGRIAALLRKGLDRIPRSANRPSFARTLCAKSSDERDILFMLTLPAIRYL